MLLAQSIIKGTVTDYINNLPIVGANVLNIYTGAGMSTDSSGKFSVKCKPGELIEISHVAFNTARVRVKNNSVLFYNMVLQPKSKKLKGIHKSHTRRQARLFLGVNIGFLRIHLDS